MHRWSPLLLTLFALACLHTRGPAPDNGVVADDFALTSDTNEVVRLAEVNDHKWAVLLFYRGDW